MFLNQTIKFLTMNNSDTPLNNFVKELLKRGKVYHVISYPHRVREISYGLENLIKQDDVNFDNVIAYGALPTPFATYVAKDLGKSLLIQRLGSLVGDPAGRDSIVVYFEDVKFRIVPEDMNIVGNYYIFSRDRSNKAVFYLE